MTNEEAIKVLDRITVKNIEQKYNTPYEIGEALNMAIKALEQEPRWIPVSERMPEENEVVLTQAEFEYGVEMAVSSRTDYNYWTVWGTRDINITAWMPLPQPYKAESEDKE